MKFNLLVFMIIFSSLLSAKTFDGFDQNGQRCQLQVLKEETFQDADAQRRGAHHAGYSITARYVTAKVTVNLPSRFSRPKELLMPSIILGNDCYCVYNGYFSNLVQGQFRDGSVHKEVVVQIEEKTRSLKSFSVFDFGNKNDSKRVDCTLSR
jgi:hypothetical protein